MGVSLTRCFSYSFIGFFFPESRPPPPANSPPIAGYEKDETSTGQQYFLPYGSCPFS